MKKRMIAAVIAVMAAAAIIGTLIMLSSADSMKKQNTHDNSAQAVDFTQVKITDEFWSARQKQVVCSILNVGIEKVEAVNGGFNNFIEATKKNNGEAAKPFEGDVYFLDSDTYKMIEAMSYALQIDADGDAEILQAQKAIEAKLNEWIPYIVGAQESDGYLDTFFTLDRGTQAMSATTAERSRWKDFAAHEFYVAGHLYEAAAALYSANGDTRLLDVAVKNADLINELFGESAGKQATGHQEIELALIKLAAACKEAERNGADGSYKGEYGSKVQMYIALAKRFLDVRGDKTGRVGYFSFLGDYGQYRQDHQSVSTQTEAVGHVVRAMYQYIAMADVALLCDTTEYDAALLALWSDVTETKSYITGGMGTEANNESFGASYDLPMNGAYAETCGSIGSVMWNQRMNLLYGDSKYADVMERTLYNAVLDGVSFDGDKFFYQNPISSDGSTGRSAWFGCACCPPNLMRLITSLGSYIYTQSGDELTLNLYIGSNAELYIDGKRVGLSLESEMPWEGSASLTVTEAENSRFTLRLRVPEWCQGQYNICINGQQQNDITIDDDGYIVLSRTWSEGDVISLSFGMEIKRTYTAEQVRDSSGYVAIMRGPLVYAAEAADNDFDLKLFTLPADAELHISHEENIVGGSDPFGLKNGVAIYGTGTVKSLSGEEQQEIRLIPYYAWNNRGNGQMRVYLNESNDEYDLVQFATASASYTSIWQELSSINDGDDSSFWCSWIEGSVKLDPWVQYDFETPVTVSGCVVNWMQDSAGVRVPSGISIEYWDGEEWQPATPTNRWNDFFPSGENEYLFEPVTTTGIRMTMNNKTINGTTYALAIYEWDLLG